VSEVQLKTLFHDTVAKAMAGKDDAGMGEGGARRSKDKAEAAATVGPVKVIGANFVRDKNKIDPATGKPVAKGYGFVEFSEHAHALIALRRLNNSAVAAKKHNGGKRLMVDFALDDARIVRQRRIKQVVHRCCVLLLVPCALSAPGVVWTVLSAASAARKSATLF
jgi:hypothetical protein